MKGFLNEGDTIILKPHFLLQHNISPEHNRAVVDYFDGTVITITIKAEEGEEPLKLTGCFDILKDFNIAESVNDELYRLLESGLQFKSFIGLTNEGRTIEIKL